MPTITSERVNDLLQQGYRNLLFVPTEYPGEYCVYGIHRTKNPAYVGERYYIGYATPEYWVDDIPF